MANTETSGIDARIAPINELRLLISEIATIKSVVMISFKR